MRDNDGDSRIIAACYEFESGYAKPVNRGVVFLNGSRDDISADNPQRWVDELFYEAIGAEEVWSDGYYLKGIRIAIEIGEATRQ